MITIAELLEDDRYKQFFTTMPKVPVVSKAPTLSPPWVLYVQLDLDGPWRTKQFEKYSDAFKFFKKLRASRGLHDAAIHNKRVAFDPPTRMVRIKGKFIEGSDGKLRQATKVVVWRPRLPSDEAQHHWCMYCRRPTIFRTYRRHRGLKQIVEELSTDIPRCCICGASARIAIPYQDRMFRHG